jgi:hypothetical protein
MLCAHMCLPGQVRGEGRYTLTLVFEAKNLKLSDFEDRQVTPQFPSWRFSSVTKDTISMCLPSVGLS